MWDVKFKVDFLNVSFDGFIGGFYILIFLGFLVMFLGLVCGFFWGDMMDG